MPGEALVVGLLSEAHRQQQEELERLRARVERLVQAGKHLRNRVDGSCAATREWDEAVRDGR